MIRELFGMRSGETATNPRPECTTINKGNTLYKSAVMEESTTENGIVKGFAKSGFNVIDSKYKNLIGQEEMDDDPAKLAALGKKIGVYVVSTSLATSKRQGTMNNMYSYKGRLEFQAIATGDSTILTSHDEISGGLDVSENGAAKAALINVSKKMSNYMLERVCSRNISYQSLATASANTRIVISGVSFSQLTAINSALKSKNGIVDIKRTLNEGTGELSVLHDVDTDKIAELISVPTLGLEITDLENNQIAVKLKPKESFLRYFNC